MPKINEPQKNQCYTEEALQRAIIEIKNGGKKKTVAAKFGIPRSTLQFRLSDKFKKIRKGPNTYLTTEEEAKLEQWILECERKGFPRRKIDIQTSVKNFLDGALRPNPFKENTPGNRWYNAFLKRHPILVQRTSEAVTSSSSNVSEDNIKKWFKEIENYLKEKGYFEILEDPKRVYNGDETCFQFCPKLGKVLAAKGEKNVYEIDLGEAKQNLTVMFTFSASGDITPPMIIFPNKRLTANISKSVPDDWGIGLSDNGWMKSDIFVDYIKKILHPYLITNGIQFPIILFLDGHKTHLTYEVSILCRELQIILVALYPNATRILQPADVSCFRPLKNSWRRAVLEWRRNNPFLKLGKDHFAPILKLALYSLKPEAISNGFRACGLHPWNANAIDYSKCLGKKSTEHEEKEESVPEALSFETFSNIMGQTKMDKIAGDCPSECSPGDCEYLSSLKSIYGFFKPNKNVNADQSIIIDINEFQFDDEMYTMEDFDAMPIQMESVAPEINNAVKISGPQNIVKTPEKTDGETVLYDVVNTFFVNECTSKEIEYYTYPRSEEREENHSKSGDLDSNKETVKESDKNEEVVDAVKHNNDSNAEKCPSIQSDILKKIEDYLLKAKTPMRKGKMTSERASYVITSTAYKKNVEEKEKIKEEKEKKKEENKRKRLLKTLQTKENDPVPKKPKNQHVESTCETHVRNLFNTEEDHLNGITSSNMNNIFVRRGVCFMCAKNIYMTNIGIKCRNCQRIYHVECLKRKNLYKDNYLCAVCNMKNCL